MSDSNFRCLAGATGPGGAAAVDRDVEPVEPIGVARERERGLRVRRHLHGHVLAGQTELHGQRKLLAGAEALRFDAEVRQRPPATRRRIVPDDARVADLHGAHGKLDTGRPAATLRGRRRRIAAAAHVLPIVAAARVAREIELEILQARVADLDAPR